MKNKFIRGFFKAVSFIITFTLLFFLLQPLFVPKYAEGSTELVNGFYNLETDSIDVLFLGASQMFCSINAPKLIEEYHISTYDFGASSQNLTTTYYYLQEALKSQSPKTVVVEVCQFFSVMGIDPSADEHAIAWSYSPTKYSIEKFLSLSTIFQGDYLEASRYCFFPLLAYHSRWNALHKTDFEMWYRKNETEEINCSGYAPSDQANPQALAFLSQNDGDIQKTPESTDTALKNIIKLCSTSRNINVIFYKSPDAVWTRNESKVVKEYMAQNGYTFLDLHDYLDEIGIDPATDFRDDHHLNTSGANKVTDFVANYLINNNLIKVY